MTSKSISELLGQGYNEFYHSRNFYRVVKGSRGSKKSKNTALDFTLKLMKYPWSNLLVIRRYSNTNRQSTFTDFKWAINRLGVQALFKFNQSIPEITYTPTGQKILFRGLDDELSITSISVGVGILSWVWFEEAYQIETIDKFETVVESIRGASDEPGFYKQVTVTFNPWNEHHWLKETFFDEDTRKRDVFARTTTYRINEWLDQQDRDRMEDLYRTNPRRARIVCDGEWGVAEGLVFENFSVKEFNPDEVPGEPIYGMDFGYTNDPTSIIHMKIDTFKRRLYIFDETYKTKMLTKDIIQALEGVDRVYADSAEPRLITEINVKSNTSVIPSVKGKGSINQGIAFLQGYEIIIHPRCEHTIEEFNTYSFKQDKTGRWLNTPEDKNNHAIDAIRYATEQFHLKRQKNRTQTMADKIKRAKALGL